MHEGFKRKVQFILVVEKISINVYVKEVQIVTSKTTKVNMQLGPSFQRPISTSSGLKFESGFLFPLFKRIFSHNFFNFGRAISICFLSSDI